MPKKPDTAMMMNGDRQLTNDEESTVLHSVLDSTEETDNEIAIIKPAPIDVANNAGDAIEASYRSAELLRSQGNLILSIAQTIKTEGDALALNIEHRAERFANMIETFNEYARQAHITFDQERTRLDQFKLPGV